MKFKHALKKLCFIYLMEDAPFTAKFVVLRLEKEVSHRNCCCDIINSIASFLICMTENIKSIMGNKYYMNFENCLSKTPSKNCLQMKFSSSVKS